jgi:hypothetical protein
MRKEVVEAYLKALTCNIMSHRSGSRTEGRNGGSRKEKNKSGYGSYKRNTQVGNPKKAVAWTRKLRHTSID